MGEFQLTARDGVNHSTFSAYMCNKVWYHYLTGHSLQYDKSGEMIPTVRLLTDGTAHELWHHRLGHIGKTVTEIIHEHVEGVPKLQANQFIVVMHA